MIDVTLASKRPAESIRESDLICYRTVVVFDVLCLNSLHAIHSSLSYSHTQKKYSTYTHVIEDNLMTAVSAGCQPVDAFK